MEKTREGGEIVNAEMKRGEKCERGQMNTKEGTRVSAGCEG